MKTAFEIIDNGHSAALHRVMKIAKKAENSALRSGARALVQSIRRAVLAKIPGAAHRNTRFSDRLVDAVRQGKPKNGGITVHILGSRDKQSGTYRLRMFEYSTPRYVKTQHGRPMRKARYTGNLGRFNGFFQQGMSEGTPLAMQRMQSTLEKMIQRAWDNG